MDQPTTASRLSGLFAPTITAYNPDASICLAGTRKFVRFLPDEGVDGLTPLGSAGEPVALTLQERKSLLEAIVAENAGQVVSPSLARTLTLRKALSCAWRTFPLSRESEDWMFFKKCSGKEAAASS